MGNLLSRPLLHVLETSLLRAAELWDRGMRYVERSLSRFLSVCLGPLFGYERPSVLMQQRACDDKGVCYIPATQHNERRRRAAADRETAAKRRKRKTDELERRKARAERAALGIAADDNAINKKRFSMDEARGGVTVEAVKEEPPRKAKKAVKAAADDRYNTAAINREMQQKIPDLIANAPVAVVAAKKRERKVSGNNSAPPQLAAAAVVAPPATKSEPLAYAALGDPIKAPPRITREEVGASPEKRKDKLWVMGNLPAASSSPSKRASLQPEPIATNYAAVPYEAPSMAPVRKTSRNGPRKPSGPPSKLLDLEAETTAANRVLLQLPSSVASAVSGGHARRASGEGQPVSYEVVASSSAVGVQHPTAAHPHIRTRKSSKTKADKEHDGCAAHAKESSGVRRLSHAIASAEPSALYAPKGTAVPSSSSAASEAASSQAPATSLLPPPLITAAPKAKHGRLSLDSSDPTLTSNRADKRLSLQITKPAATPPPSSSSNPASPLGVLSKARASLDSLRLTQTIRPRLNSVTNGAVAAASAIGRAATPPVLSSLVGGGAGGSGSNPASPTSEDGSAAPRSVAELADRACMSRWEAKGKERKVWRDEVNRVARERCIAAAAASSTSLILGGNGGGSSSGAPTPRSGTPVGSNRPVRKDGASSPVTPTPPNVVYNSTRQGLANLAVQNLGLTGGGAEARRGSKDEVPTAPIVDSMGGAPLARRKSARERPARLEGIEEASLGRSSKVNDRLSLGPTPSLVQPKAVRGVAA